MWLRWAIAPTFSLKAKDAAGNLSGATSYTWTIDILSPVPPVLDSTPDDESALSSASSSFHDAEGSPTFRCRIDGGSYAACTSPQSSSGLADGLYTFDVTAVDLAGNPSTATSFTWDVDTTPPPVPVIDAHPADPTKVTSATFEFSDSEEGATFVCPLDGASYSACWSPKSYTGLAGGSHAFDVKAADVLNNVSSASSFTTAGPATTSCWAARAGTPSPAGSARTS